LSKSSYVAYAQIDDKKAQRILKKLVDMGLVTTEGQAKANGVRYS
jgi:predicted transcriptional regulator